MNTRSIKAAVASALLLTTLSIAHAADSTETDRFTGNIGGYLGQKSLDDNDWGELDRQGSLGVIFDFKKKSWPVSIAADVIISGNEDKENGIKAEGGTMEVDLGVRKIFELSDASIKPYIGGGIALIGSGIRTKSGATTISDDDDTATGAWIGGGMYYAATKSVNVGLDLRYSEAEASISGKDVEVGGFHTGITVGYHW